MAMSKQDKQTYDNVREFFKTDFERYRQLAKLADLKGVSYEGIASNFVVFLAVLYYTINVDFFEWRTIEMTISKDMVIGDLIALDQNLAAILMASGMGCVGCPSAQGFQSLQRKLCLEVHYVGGHRSEWPDHVPVRLWHKHLGLF